MKFSEFFTRKKFGRTWIIQREKLQNSVAYESNPEIQDLKTHLDSPNFYKKEMGKNMRNSLQRDRLQNSAQLAAYESDQDNQGFKNPFRSSKFLLEKTQPPQYLQRSK